MKSWQIILYVLCGVSCAGLFIETTPAGKVLCALMLVGLLCLSLALYRQEKKSQEK
ncbi:MAG: hypothetical protein IJ154_09130 [Bacteroidales bacterium]|nr:hypothetical protein [Bacteroidales bacterium]